MNDDRIDELLIRGARDYNEPGSVPREDMWSRIEAERRGGSATVAPASAGRRWIIAVAGIAAAAVLTVGIVIGRRMERATTPVAPTIARKSTVVAPSESAAVPRPAQVAATPQKDSIVAALRNETRKTDARARQLAESSNASAPSDNLAYRLVVLRHLAGSEAMITAFRSSAQRGEVDAEIADWSRELLGTTRMLEASRVAQDPTMKRLLEDLDLVIVQIARYATTGKSNPDDLDLIEQSINKRGVLAKLRSTARTLPAGT